MTHPDPEARARELVTLANTVSVERWTEAIAQALREEREQGYRRGIEDAAKACFSRSFEQKNYGRSMEAQRCAKIIRALVKQGGSGGKP